MVSSNASKRRVGLFLVFAVGSGFLAMHVRHALGPNESVETFLLGILLPMGLAVGVLAGGGWLYRREVGGEYALRVGAWCVIGAVVLAAAAVMTVLYEQAEGVIMSDRLFVVVNGATAGAAVGFVTGVYNSRQRAAQLEADRLSRRLTVLNRALRHDIRNNANVIRGNAELLADGRGEGIERACTIREQAADLVELGERARKIERVLYDDDVDVEVVDVVSVVEACCERCRRDHPAAEIDLSLPERRPIVAHPLVESALRNVIENAIVHNDERTPRVEITSDTVCHDGTEAVELRIADNGPGIPEDERVALERGYETNLEHTTGLGLWLVNWIVAGSGGDVRFEANEPGGSVVRLRFERPDADRPIEDESFARPHAVGGSA
jgi:signal transduction histidine kinase